ncbi:hypothetical protein ANO11243_075960 [Dothideomycetidae sp. 11243]|nr:hypothetical protein ANO11243_075960 [fungal sp. No.11243]
MHVQADPERHVKEDPFFYRSFDLVLSIDQPRAFEIALSDLIWPDVRETAKSAFSEDQAEAYLAACTAFLRVRSRTGSWPGPENRRQVTAMIEVAHTTDRATVDRLVQQLCEEGLGGCAQTRALLSHLAVSDGVQLMTGCGPPVNNTSLEDVIEILGEA